MKGGPEQHALGAFDGSFNLWAAEGRARGAACCAHVCNPHSEGSRETPPSASLVRTLFLFPKPRRRDRVGSVETTEGRCFFFFWGGGEFSWSELHVPSILFFMSTGSNNFTLRSSRGPGRGPAWSTSKRGACRSPARFVARCRRRCRYCCWFRRQQRCRLQVSSSPPPSPALFSSSRSRSALARECPWRRRGDGRRKDRGSRNRIESSRKRKEREQ